MVSEWVYAEGVCDGKSYELTLPNLDCLIWEVMSKRNPKLIKIDIQKAFQKREGGPQ